MSSLYHTAITVPRGMMSSWCATADNNPGLNHEATPLYMKFEGVAGFTPSSRNISVIIGNLSVS